ncbi:MAG: tRNA pseudouridine(55) synthase TruB [Desulfitobacteriaceae bacterium]|nr:tRNA pseudouridine(55) synthase TruB [Desulfitobacteriaceae bacterium]MDD4751776.1 tRNA pseudouridine(55) synthase TruB [Desulfitobacteriaceae bacterium]
MDGFINLLKPPGMTSHDAVNQLRNILSYKKIGHTGTLDPGATGVLPICLGKATRLAEYLTELPKIYRAEITLGVATDTQDCYGKIERVCDCAQLEQNRFVQVLPEFLGEQKQVPPMVSAVRVGGKRLYELAREGIKIDRTPRTINIYDLNVIKFSWELPHPKVIIDVQCSKGTYIRTLCHDIGERLKVGAHMSYLIRTRSGPFKIQDAFIFEEIIDYHQREDSSFIQSMQAGICFLPVIQVDNLQARSIVHGNPVKLFENPYLENQVYRVETEDKVLLAIGKVQTGAGQEVQVLRPIKVLAS